MRESLRGLGGRFAYLFEYFDESPVLDVRLGIRSKDQNLLALGAHSNHAAIGTPRETLNAWQDAIRSVSWLLLQHCWVS